MGSKEGRNFLEALGIRAELCHAKGTPVIAREFPVAVYGCGETRNCSHGQVYSESEHCRSSRVQIDRCGRIRNKQLRIGWLSKRTANMFLGHDLNFTFIERHLLTKGLLSTKKGRRGELLIKLDDVKTIAQPIFSDCTEEAATGDTP